MKIKKLFYGVLSFALCFALLGCSSAQTSVAYDINTKMDRTENVIKSIQIIDREQLLISDLIDDIVQVSTTFPNAIPNFSRNTDSYGNYIYNGLGYNCNGNNCYGGYGNYGYGYGYGNVNGVNNFYGNGFNNAYYNGYYNGYRGNNGIYNYGSNIDTYRPIANVDVEEVSNNNTNFEFINLSNSCKSCLDCNYYCENLQNSILQNIDYVRELANKINLGEITLSNSQIESVNELLRTISTTCSKINMSKGELNNLLANVIANKLSYKTNTNSVNAKYVRLLGCIDTRNSYLQTILNSLLQLECSINGKCLDNCLYGDINNIPKNDDKKNIDDKICPDCNDSIDNGDNNVINNQDCKDCNQEHSPEINKNNETCQGEDCNMNNQNNINSNNNFITNNDNDNKISNDNIIDNHSTVKDNMNNDEQQNNNIDNNINKEDTTETSVESSTISAKDLNIENDETESNYNSEAIANNDEIIKDNLINNKPKHSFTKLKEKNHTNEPIVSLNENNVEKTNSIFNENNQENNKSLTA